ncbi:MAG: T9SS type A sorting domain-containing protein [Melioribacteraceae bacterium]|nr:T9SS type A sorting domain-containing protein [Melioribacteraceae bacterium]MCF8353557.1 T9SS type A sorting domain-containing protein [Melioribacteraceae bacterium]MCF8392509.1 T9SS type A sorting domain-containing protein [Melioribacteraceae bacterium]MCF8418476.1 T9SS type A sorting domain-containing protein [Melioribacteraceae bacterium]
MQIKKALLFWIFISTLISAQVVVTVPQYSTQNDSIKIVFDATQAENDALVGYSGDLYTHTGVTIQIGDNPPQTWQHVIGTWGDNTAQPKLTRVAPDIYELLIGYPRDFYNVTNANEQIRQFSFVFRSANGNLQTEDIFVDLYLPGVTVVVNEPIINDEFGDPLRSPVFANQGDTVDISISTAEISTETESITLYKSGIELASSDGNTLYHQYIVDVSDEGPTEFLAVAQDTSGLSDSLSFFIFSNPAPISEMPPAGVIEGVNYHDEDASKTTLALLAPYKEFIYVIGDFNDWKVDVNYMMKRYEFSADSVVYWLTIYGLTAQEEYAFQYLVDGNLRIADPYTDKVLDPWNDPWIPNSVYPNLKDYPDGKTNEIVSVLQTGQNAYTWQLPDFDQPDQEKLVIYELLIRDFISTHSYQTLIDTISYLKTLGVNTIGLMPASEFEGNSSWGYNPSFYFAPDKYYGTKDKLKEFIDVCHQNEIAVVLDMVLNHAFGQNTMARLYWENGKPSSENLWFNVNSPNPVYSWGSDFNHLSRFTKTFSKRVMEYWLTEYKFDGFRFDFSKGFTNVSGDGWAYNSQRIAIWKDYADFMWSIDPETYVILEHFTDNNEEIELSDYGLMLWGNLNYNYNEATMGWHEDNKSDFSGVSYKVRGWNEPHLVGYMESHDEERLMFKNLEYGNGSGSYDITNLNTALNRMKLAAAFFLTVPGPKMIWQFGELGYDYSINHCPDGTLDDGCRVSEKPIRWDYMDYVNRLNLYKTFAALIDLRRFDAFHTSDFIMGVSNPVKRIRLNHETMNVNILGNFDVVTRTTSGIFQNTGWWYDYFSGDSMIVTDVNTQIELAPGEFHIYTTEKLPTPEPGILVNINDRETAEVTTYKLEQNYPNPFNPTTQINYQVPEAGFVTLKIYNMLGQEVKTLVSQNIKPGTYSVSWNGKNNYGDQVSTGVYIYRIETPKFNESRKMILLK